MNLKNVCLLSLSVELPYQERETFVVNQKRGDDFCPAPHRCCRHREKLVADAAFDKERSCNCKWNCGRGRNRSGGAGRWR